MSLRTLPHRIAKKLRLAATIAKAAWFSYRHGDEYRDAVQTMMECPNCHFEILQQRVVTPEEFEKLICDEHEPLFESLPSL